MKNAINQLSKATTLLLSITLFALTSHSQDDQPKETFMKKFYAVGAAGVATSNGASWNLGFQSVMKNNWSASLSYQHLETDPKNLPANYQRGMNIVLIIPIPEPKPVINTNLINLTIGKYLPTGRRTWFTAEAGPSIVKSEEMTFISQEVTSGGIFLLAYSETSNYTHTTTKKNTVGGTAKVDFNCAFLPWLGMGVNVYGNVNSIQSTAGFQVMFTAGWMNPKKKH